MSSLANPRVVVGLAVVSCVASLVASIAALVAVLGPREAVPVATECHCAEPAVASPEPAPAPVQTPSPDSEPPELGQSVGHPRAGVLQAGVRLEPGPGYIVRNPLTAYATDATVAHLRSAIAAVNAEFPTLHPVLVGDLSLETGGPIAGHLSHQSGRDVDVGLYYRKRPRASSRAFVDGTKDNLHFAGTLALIRALAATHDDPRGVEWILLDYGLQKLLYKFAKKQGASDEELARLFQYPAGSTAKTGLLRHFPGHRNHLHVRFRCRPEDPLCHSPADAPTYPR